MAEAQAMERAHPLEGRATGGASVTLRPAAPAKRVSLRVPSANIAAVSKALGVALPKKPKQSATAGARSVLWLGPDEWLVIEEGDRDIETDLARAKTLYAAVDVSHRSTAILVSGSAAADVLNAGCPQDLSLEAFPVGGCSRTVLGRTEIVLYRSAETDFRVECWRSFSTYAFDFLEDAARAL
jgi:sarcosine oxidase subunit gamma